MSARPRIQGLLDEQPISVYPSLAKRVGVNKAIILQQLHFLVTITENGSDPQKYHEKHWWVYNTYAEWHERYFPWLAVGTLKRMFIELERDKIILSRTSPYDVSDQTKWYTIDYAYWPTWFSADSPSQNVTGTRHKMRRSPSHKVTPPVTKCADVYTENTSETTPEIQEPETAKAVSTAAAPTGEQQVSDPASHSDDKPTTPAPFQVGDKVVWARESHGGYGYVHYIPCTVVKLTAKRVSLECPSKKGGTVLRSVDPKNLYCTEAEARAAMSGEVFEQMTPLQQAVGRGSYGLKPGQGITPKTKVLINTIVGELYERFGRNGDAASPAEVDAAYQWFSRKDGHPALPTEPPKVGKMVEDHRTETGYYRKTVAPRHFPKGRAGCTECNGNGQKLAVDGSTIPCPACLAAEKGVSGD